MPTMELVAAGLRAATFVVAIFAVLVASQLYNLIKSGELAQTWRPFILGALVFAGWALASFANTFFGFLFEEGRTIALLMDLLLAVFILLFAIGLWGHRQMFYHPDRLRRWLDRGESGYEGIDDDIVPESAKEPSRLGDAPGEQ